MARKKTAERAAGEGGSALGQLAQMSGSKQQGDRSFAFAERLRDHKELESRWAVLQEARVEYFRGRDFAALLRSHPDLKQELLGEGDATADEDAVGNLLLKRKLIVRCDRVLKTVRPGKKKLSKWPARIEVFADQSFAEDDAFFAWAFERRRPLWQTILSFLLPIVTVACCLFPIFPHWCKLSALYFCLSFLTLIFGLLTVRGAIFGTLWILLGWRIWFFPNILAEAATLSELFQFWPETKSDDPPPKRSTRLVVTLLTAASVWLCVHHAPNEAARARYRKRVSNIIDDVVMWRPNVTALNGRVAEEASAVVNETLPNRTKVDETPQS